MSIQLTPEKLKGLIREGVKEGINSELMKFRAMLLPYVSEKEQKEIERLYKKPSRKKAKEYKIKI